MAKLREVLKGMSRKEQLDYIWEYYKLHIIGFILLIIFGWLMIDGFMNKGNEPVGITVVSEATIEVIDELELSINSLEFTDFDLFFEHIYHQGGLIENNAYDMMERLSMRIAVGQVDIMVTDDLFAEQLINEDIFLPLKEVIEPDQIDSFEEEGLVVNGVLYGIKTADLKIFDQYDVYQDTYLLVPASGRHREEAKQVIEYLTE
ncbi:hypothetical protein KQI76_02180 [Amphibacillus sp. MSJ-3]|uniref:hypothetical protein n=1 Tax=Amphibacillus sp. MSJ-3 TaxID=2841505 RepID=UPI001C0E9DB3|nr:hypothetical protein [Amphibacillus sp. MSJ-3]MBU5593960.1 hypothetical protein [Amphibacillus sp. MSJ-3]